MASGSNDWSNINTALIMMIILQQEQQTPLHIAARLGNVDNVTLLLQLGAAPDAVTKDLYTPLHIAAKEGHEEVASVLLEHRASHSLTTKVEQILQSVGWIESNSVAFSWFISDLC